MKRIVYLLFVVLASCGVDEIEPQAPELSGVWERSNKVLVLTVDNGYRWSNLNPNYPIEDYGTYSFDATTITLNIDSSVYLDTVIYNRVITSPYTLTADSLIIQDARYARR